MSMYKVVSWLLEKVFAMTSVLSVCSLDKTLLAFPLLHFVLQGQTYCYSGDLLTSYFFIPITYEAKDISWGC